MITRILLTSLLVLFVGPTFLAEGSTLQKRDHLTQKEVDLVKEAQALDKRIEVFIKASQANNRVCNCSSRSGRTAHGPGKLRGRFS